MPILSQAGREDDRFLWGEAGADVRGSLDGSDQARWWLARFRASAEAVGAVSDASAPDEQEV